MGAVVRIKWIHQLNVRVRLGNIQMCDLALALIYA